MNKSHDKCMWSTDSGCHFAQTANPNDMSFVFQCPAERSARIAFPGMGRDKCRPCKYACKGANGLGCGDPSNEEDPSCMSELCSVTCASADCMEKMCSKKFNNCGDCMNKSHDKCMWSTDSGCHFAQTANPNDMSFVFQCPAERSARIAFPGMGRDKCRPCKYACKGANGLGCGDPSNEEDP